MENTTLFTGATLALLAWIGLGLLMIRFITPAERRLVASAALVLAGLFLLARRDGSVVTVTAVASGVVGLVIFVRAAAEWWKARARTSKAAPLAVVVVLPAAFLGAILLIGVLVSAAAAPARLVSRWMVGG